MDNKQKNWVGSFFSETLHRLHFFSVISRASRLTLVGALATSLPQRAEAEAAHNLFSTLETSLLFQRAGKRGATGVSLWLVYPLFSQIYVRWLAVAFLFSQPLIFRWAPSYNSSSRPIGKRFVTLTCSRDIWAARYRDNWRSLGSPLKATHTGWAADEIR